MTTKEKVLKRFPNVDWYSDYERGYIRLANEVEAEEWNSNKICLKIDCLSEDVFHINNNAEDQFEEYECNSCGASILMGYEIKLTCGFVDEEDKK
jgi:hypothetical protein